MRNYIFCYYPDEDDSPAILYRVKAEDGAAGSWYQQAISISAFERRLLKRWDKTRVKSNGFLRTGQVEAQYHVNEGNPEYHFNSVWEFYEAIGYDYKNTSAKHIDVFLSDWKPIHLKVERYFRDKESI